MIITCINCETRFFVDEEALGGVVGRRVRCASCGNTWRYQPDEATLRAAVVGVPLQAEEVPSPVETAPTPAEAPAAKPAEAELRPEPEPAAAAPRDAARWVQDGS